MARFAANLTMMFNEYDFLDRFAAAAKAGFGAVEYLFPYDWPADEIARRLKENALEQVLFNMPPGDWAGGERGLACLPGREAEFRDGVGKAIGYAKALGCPRLHAMAGLRPQGATVADLRATYVDNVAFATQAAKQAGIELLLEPINTVDMPGFFLDDFGTAAELIEAVRKKCGIAPRLQFDIYHCAKIHGDVANWIRRTAPLIAHFQIAGTPSRNEPDRGDLPLAEILQTVAEVAPQLWIGCEYRPAGKTEDGLGWIARFR